MAPNADPPRAGSGDLNAAVAAYRGTVRVHPDFADGWNNLAQVLLEQGKRKEAAEAISKAIALGGNRLPAYQALQLRIDGQ